MIDIVSHLLAVIVGAGIYHQWLKRSPETLRAMLDKVKKLDD